MEPEVPDFDFDAHIAELIARRYVPITSKSFQLVPTCTASAVNRSSLSRYSIF